jgi:hypothetical protein
MLRKGDFGFQDSGTRGVELSSQRNSWNREERNAKRWVPGKQARGHVVVVQGFREIPEREHSDTLGAGKCKGKEFGIIDP